MPSPPDGVGSDPVRATTVVYPPKGDQDTAELNLDIFHYLTIFYSGLALIREFTLRYSNASTRRQYEAELSDLFHHAGVEHPRELTESAVLAWCGSFRANNTVRNRLLRACTYPAVVRSPGRRRSSVGRGVDEPGQPAAADSAPVRH